MRRTCPRCECLSPTTADYCVACGYRIVVSPKQRASVAATASKVPVVVPVAGTGRPRATLKRCVFCGAPSRSDVCPQHEDLT